VAGLVAIGVWAWSDIRSAVYQDWGSWVLDRRLRGEPATVSRYLNDKKGQIAEAVRGWFGSPSAPKPPPAPSAGPPPKEPPAIANGDLVGRLVIPRLHLNAIVREGAGEDTLDVALGHIPHTAFPGEKGNVGIAGHRDTIFRSLRQIGKDDLIQFQTLSGKYAYEVESTEIVKPSDVGVLDAGDHAEITLVTCYPFYYVGSAPDRFIVKARLVSESSAGQEVAATKAPAVPRERETAARSGIQRVNFQVSENHSRELVPGISFGLSRADAGRRRANGWMWVMPDRRTIWLRDQAAYEPVVFYGFRDGQKRELTITRVSENSVAGYLTVYGESRAAAEHSRRGGTDNKRRRRPRPTPWARRADSPGCSACRRPYTRPAF